MFAVGSVGLMTLQGCTGAEYTEESIDSSESALAASCYANFGLNPTKAALAVAMATELGRWDPLNDLEQVRLANMDIRVRLKSTAVCIKNSCKQTKAILGQQDFTPDQANFSASGLASDLWASFDRQRNLITDLTNNNKPALPPAHKLTL